MKRTKIDWAESTWNPITGCTGPAGDGWTCRYCYAERFARRMAGRFGYPSAFPDGDPFAPTFHPDRLSEPSDVQRPTTVFAGSMGDTFGPGVDPGWIDQVGTAMAMAPHHRYLLLTRHPSRYALLPALPEYIEVWYGTTITGGEVLDEKRLEDLLAFGQVLEADAVSRRLWVSVEPLLATPEYSLLRRMHGLGWVVMGALSGQTDDARMEQVEVRRAVALVKSAAADAPLFLKRSMHAATGWNCIRQDTPWDGAASHVAELFATKKIGLPMTVCPR